MPGSERTRQLLYAGLTLLWAVALGSLGATEVTLFILPVVLLFVPLLFGVYVGEDRVLALRRPRARRRCTVAARSSGRPPSPRVPRGGLLLASSLAERPPPATA